MTKKQFKIWKNACDNAKKKRGYIPAELLALPSLIGLAEDGVLGIYEDKDMDMVFITNKPIEEKNNDKLDTN